MKRIVVTGEHGKLSIAIAKWLKQKGEFNVVNVSVRDDRWRDLDFSGVYSIIHVAGITPQNMKREEQYKTINTDLTINLAKKAHDSGVAQFVYISSMAVYGISENIIPSLGTVTADTDCHPRETYGMSKLLAENGISQLSSDSFHCAMIRVPSIYGYGKTEYLRQYEHLADKFPLIPIAFVNCYKSIIYIDNLCELVYYVVSKNFSGIVCPDDGPISVVEICAALKQYKKKSLVMGKIFELLFRKNERVNRYYGSLCYAENLTNIFSGKYRVKDKKELLKIMSIILSSSMEGVEI